MFAVTHIYRHCCTLSLDDLDIDLPVLKHFATSSTDFCAIQVYFYKGRELLNQLHCYREH